MRSLISIDFPAQKWNLKACMWCQQSPFTGSDGRNSGSGKPSQNRLRLKEPLSLPFRSA